MADRGNEAKSFTGRQGRHQTRWSVKLADRVSSVVITVGGIATIVAVCLVFFLLLAVVLPMFRSASLASAHRTALPVAAAPLHMAVDEYRVMAWAVFPDGELRAFRTDTGEVVWQDRLLEEGLSLRDFSFVNSEGHFAAARSDGKVQLGKIEFKPTFVEPDTLPPALQDLAAGAVATLGEGVVQVTPQQQFRKQQLDLERTAVVDLADQPLRRIHHGLTSTGIVVAGIRESGGVVFAKLRERKNVLTGESSWTSRIQDLPSPASSPPVAPDHVFVTGRGDNVYAIWSEGELVRYVVPGGQPATIAEQIDLLPSNSERNVTAADLVIGRETLLVGDSGGGLRAWFLVRHSDAETPDGSWLLPVHELPSGTAAVRDLGISQRSRLVAVAYDNGRVQIVHVTNASQVLAARVSEAVPVDHVMLAPKDDGLWAMAGGELWGATFDPAYPEVNFQALFRPMWFEGYEGPEYVWQSSFAGVQSEMKLGLMPLIFGTLKATVYSMLFGVPIALLAAIYTSEFLNPKYRNRVKSLIEMMASLPSVVLGFLGGLVIAPVVERFVPSAICAAVTVPVCCLLGAFFWQQLPHRFQLQWSGYRLILVSLSLLVGGFFAWQGGAYLESWFFAGDIMLWLDQQRGTGTGAWLFMLLPLSALVVAAVVSRHVNPWILQNSGHWSRRRCAAVNLLKFVVGVLLAAGLALAVSSLMTAVGLDPRGSVTGTYVQRNAMVVGFVMGFAIIPIIYTISEDSLSTVPRHLRSASLGSGATALQTAMRVVVPTAMSGLFSAIMIGLGRAVGETMIVLMAAGNTPIMDWNIFNGFRTLSANIAVELPEAVRDSTHYRTLFLAALTLLLLTFIINTVAELVRLRFRRRAVQL